MKNIQDALKAIKEVSVSEGALSTLLDFERVIDSLDVYAFRHWKSGELVEGPIYEKYFVTCTFMWPYKKMPDPRGGQQLLTYNCSISYKKDRLEYPIKIKSGNDYKPGTMVPKTAKVPIWLVTVVMPKSLMAEISRGVIDVETDDVDKEGVEQAYSNGIDDDEVSNQGMVNV